MEYEYKRIIKEIPENEKLYPEKIGLLPLGTDEVYVPIKSFRNYWISNYGQILSLEHGKYKPSPLKKEKDGFYVTLKKKKQNEIFNIKHRIDSLVYNHFFIVKFTSKYAIWHAGNDSEDNYYMNLYYLPKKVITKLKTLLSNGEFDSDDVITELYTKYIRNELPTVINKGFWGTDKIDSSSEAYVRWKNMLHRCYDEKIHEKFPKYEKCEVCDEWLNFSNFKKYWDENYYSIDGEKMDLDHDILVKGNVLYSPSKCCIVPHAINTLIIYRQERLSPLPVGVWFDKAKNKFRAEMDYYGKKKKLGTFNTAEEAFVRYKECKEKQIKEVAELYKGRIPENVYVALMNWTVEITD